MKKSYPLNKTAITSKIKAATWHFLCSILIFLIALAWIRWFLYPQFHFALNGVWYGLRLVAGVDLVLGPLITLLVYHHAKPQHEKIGDFAIIGIIQAAALAYGLHTMYQEHPRMLTFYQYGNVQTVTQREYTETADKLPHDFSTFSQIAGVPIAVYHQHETTITHAPLTPTELQTASTSVRQNMIYDEDKQTLAELDKQYGQLYILSIMGKYQGAFVALDKEQNIITIFGQRDLH